MIRRLGGALDLAGAERTGSAMARTTFLLENRVLGVLGFLVLLAVFFSLVADNFAAVANANTIALNGSILVVVACAESIVVITRNYDLSVGSVVALASYVGLDLVRLHPDAGPILVLAYNAELFGGIIHTDLGFATAWGAFPVLVAYTAQTGRLAPAAVLAAAGALAMSAAQRKLSTPARMLRRRSVSVQGSVTLADGQVTVVDQQMMLAPLESALRAMSWGLILLAASLAVARLI